MPHTKPGRMGRPPAPRALASQALVDAYRNRPRALTLVKLAREVRIPCWQHVPRLFAGTPWPASATNLAYLARIAEVLGFTGEGLCHILTAEQVAEQQKMARQIRSHWRTARQASAAVAPADVPSRT